MTAFCEMSEVICALMHLLHKGRLCVYESAWLKDTSNLGNDLTRIENVFQDRLDDNAIKRIVWEGNTARRYIGQSGEQVMSVL